MKKFLLAVFALALVVAFTAPAHAAKSMKKPAKKMMKGPSLKMTGLFRVRGLSTNNEDRNDDDQDGVQFYEQLVRPRFTITSLGGKMVAMWEADVTVYQCHNHEATKCENPADADAGDRSISGGKSGAFGGDGRDVRTNRVIFDFAIPGSALRMRLGRMDYTSPDGEIFDTGGKSRLPGIAVYGKLSKTVSLSMFNSKRDGGTSAENDDQDNYMVALGMKVSPTLSLTPWVANSRDSGDAAKEGYDYWYGALTAKAKVGVFSLNATGVVQAGEMSSTEDISAWGLLVRASTSLGRLKLMGNVTLLSGDDTADDGEKGQFTTPGNGASGWFQGGQIMTAKRWMSFNNKLRDREYKKANGMVVLEGLMEYKVSNTLTIGGGVSVYQSAEASLAPNVNDSKDVGTEVNVGLSWNIYPGLNLKAVGAYMANGDYGVAEGVKPDDTWLVGWQLDHTF